MDRPQIRRARAPVDGPTWWVASARFATAVAARKGWERVAAKVPKGSLGIYRHGPPDAPGTMVSAVSMEEEQLERVVRHLEATGGKDQRLAREVEAQLIMRRAHVVLAAGAEGLGEGRLKWRRPERGARLNPDGTMEEPGGHG